MIARVVGHSGDAGAHCLGAVVVVAHSGLVLIYLISRKIPWNGL